jgi:hypothetical protein
VGKQNVSRDFQNDLADKYKFPTAAEFGQAIRNAIKDAAMLGKCVRTVHVNANGELYFTFGEPEIYQARAIESAPKKPDNTDWMTRRYVYVIGAETGPVKIGVAAEPVLRIRELQTGNPRELQVLAQCRGGEETEATLHSLFERERLQGEWFKRSSRVRTLIDMMASGVGISLIIERCRRPRDCPT